MKTSSRFVVATHILSAMAAFKLASGKCRSLKSDFISESVNTNPVVIRRILSMLRKAGLVRTQTGPDGGSTLGKDPQEITLLDIYEAVEEGGLFQFHYREPNPDCPIGYTIQAALRGICYDAEQAAKGVLRDRTLLAVTEDIMRRSGITDKLKGGLTADELRRDYAFHGGAFVKRT